MRTERSFRFDFRTLPPVRYCTGRMLSAIDEALSLSSWLILIAPLPRDPRRLFVLSLMPDFLRLEESLEESSAELYASSLSYAIVPSQNKGGPIDGPPPVIAPRRALVSNQQQVEHVSRKIRTD